MPRKRSSKQPPQSAGEARPQAAPRGPDALALTTLVLLPLVFFWRALLLRGFLLQSDICYQFEPLNALLHDTVRAGRLPLWTPSLYCGYPIAAEGQIAAFYPPALLLAWLLPSPGAVTWTIVLHALLAGVSMYLLARRLGLSPFGAWLAALVFSFSGYFFAHVHHVGLFRTSAWLPLVLLFVDRAWHDRPAANAGLAALAWAAAALCGHPQTLFFISLAVALWVLARLLGSPRASRAALLPKALGVVALVFVLGLGLAAVQLLLTAELQSRSPHGDVGSLEYVTSFSLLPRHLLGLIAPNWQGTPAFNTYRGERYYWEYVLYLGIAPLILALIGASTRRGRIWLGVGLLALALALAQGNPAYHVLRLLPGFAHFRAPARYIFFFTFAAALLAGCGWDRVRVAPSLKPGRRAALAAALIGVITILDLFSFDKTLAPLAGPEVFEARPRIVEFLEGDPVWGRSFIVPPITIYADWSPPQGWAANPDGWLEARVYLPADVPQSFDLPVVSGYLGFVDPDHEMFFQTAAVEPTKAHTLNLYSLVGTRHFVVGPDIPVPNLPAADVPPFRVYLNEKSFPRAFAVQRVITAPGRAEALQATVALARADQLREVAVTHGPLQAWSPDASTTEILGIDEPRPERIAVRARADGRALVVLNERWDPGWRARVDRQPAPIVEVDSVLMGAPIPAGEHTVEFLYQPRGLIVGRGITFVSLAALALILASAGLTRRRIQPS